jgi:hypothetical protein
MVYVDLNPIRAGLAGSPEESDFTSIQERIRAWQKETMTIASVPTETAQHLHTEPPDGDIRMVEVAGEVSSPNPEPNHGIDYSCGDAVPSAIWLCPIRSDSRRRGILHIDTLEYFDLVDKSGRMMRSDKRGAIDADLTPILLRISANPDAWLDTISRFGSRFRVAAGLLSNLRSFADQLGRRWLTGVATARASFSQLPPQLA